MTDLCGAPRADATGAPVPCTNVLPCADHPFQGRHSCGPTGDDMFCSCGCGGDDSRCELYMHFYQQTNEQVPTTHTCCKIPER